MTRKLRSGIAFLLVAYLSLLLRGAEPAAAAAPAVNHVPAINNARSLWVTEGNQIADILRGLRRYVGQAIEIQKKLERDREALRELKRQRDRALRELRAGAFCTGCGKTRTQIEALGESFPHPGQQTRPATPEELERAEKEFDNRMTPLRLSIDRSESDLKAAESEINSLHHRFLVLLPQFHKHIAEEQDARLLKWADEKTVSDTDLKVLRETFAAKKKELGNTADPQEVRALAAIGQRWNQRAASARSTENRARDDERSYRRDVNAQFDSLAAIAAGIVDFRGVSGSHLATQVKNPPRPVGYSIAAVYVGGLEDAVGDIQQLLQGPAKPGPQTNDAKSSADKKSVNDLLNGK